MATEKTIVLKGQPDRVEVKGSAKITPGHLLQFDTNGDVTTHATAGGNTIGTMVAVEQDWLGKEIGNEYAVSDLVQIALAQKGNILNMLLALGENVVKGDPLESTGDGTLRKHAHPQVDSNGSFTDGQILYGDPIVGYAWEAVNNAGSSSSVRIATLIT